MLALHKQLLDVIYAQRNKNMIKTILATAALAMLISGPALAAEGSMQSMERSAKDFCANMNPNEFDPCMGSMKKMMMKHMKHMKQMKK